MTAGDLGGAVCGFFLGTIVLNFAVRWVFLVAAAWSQASLVAGGAPSMPRLALTVACQSLFHSGPWLLAVAGFFAWHVRSEPWAPWFLGGALASIVFLGCVAFIATLNLGKARAAHDAGEAGR